jgi:SCY1-like protein 1
MDAWGDMEEDSFFDAPSESTTKAGATTSVAENPFNDNGEPDFAGWLAAQVQKKTSAAKSLPKGLTKPAASRTATTRSVGDPGTKKAAATATKSQVKPVVAKKIDIKPKTTDNDEWGDGW